MRGLRTNGYGHVYRFSSRTGNLVGSCAFPSAATVAKTETKNGTTLKLNPKKLKQAKTETKNGTTVNLNLKKAKTESENGRFILHGHLCPSKFILDGA